jgi:predicted pyridoxine 5'-phosphate oxidase superfamily flavin-nucleotide-binding protein
MSEAAVELYIKAQADRSDELISALADLFTDDIVIETSRGNFEGKAAALAQVGSGQAPAVFQQATWSDPKKEGASLSLSGRLPITAAQGGYDLRFDFAPDGRVRRIQQITVPAPPLPPSPLRLSDDLKQLIKDAWNTSPMLVAAVDPNGQPRLSLRGTVQAISDDRLAFWARNADGGTVGGLEKNPLVTLFYRNPGTRTTFYFYGRAHVTRDEQERRLVYDNSPEPERLADFHYRGLAVIIELDKVEGVTPAGRVHLAR